MIKVDNKKKTIQFQGIEPELLTEFSIIVRELHEAGVSKEGLERNFKMGFMNKEEITKETLKALKSNVSISKDLEELIDKLFSKEDKNA